MNELYGKKIKIQPEELMQDGEVLCTTPAWLMNQATHDRIEAGDKDLNAALERWWRSNRPRARAVAMTKEGGGAKQNQ